MARRFGEMESEYLYIRSTLSRIANIVILKCIVYEVPLQIGILRQYRALIQAGATHVELRNQQDHRQCESLHRHPNVPNERRAVAQVEPTLIYPDSSSPFDPSNLCMPRLKGDMAQPSIITNRNPNGARSSELIYSDRTVLVACRSGVHSSL